MKGDEKNASVVNRKVIHVSYKGQRDENEDAMSIVQNNTANVYAIYDGHGGDKISKYLHNNLPKYFINQKIKYPLHKKNIYDIFNKIQTKISNTYKRQAIDSGSTCLCVVEYDNNNMHIINTGDCRCVLSRDGKAIPLTNDHKPELDSEKKRINKVKGDEKVYLDDEGTYRIGPLSVSRAFGDLDTAPYITHKPDISNLKIQKKDNFLILGCDGIWDVVKNQEAVDFVLKNDKNSARKLASYALKKGSSDNISLIIVYLNE